MTIQKTLYEFILQPACPHRFKSKANGGLYCKKAKPGCGNYCIENPGHAGCGGECPLGRARIYPVRN